MTRVMTHGMTYMHRRALLVCALVIAALPAACKRDAAPGVVFQKGSLLDSADQVGFGTRTLVTDAGLLRAEIFADTTMFLDNNARIAMRGVHGDFFNAQGSKDATLVAQRAQYNQNNQRLEAWGNVIVTSVDGRVLRSPMLVYSQSMNQISSDSLFTLVEPDGKEVQGIGFDADPNLAVINVRRVLQGRGGSINLGDP